MPSKSRFKGLSAPHLPRLGALKNLPPELNNERFKVQKTTGQTRVVESITVVDPETGREFKSKKYHGYVVGGTYYSITEYKDAFDRFGRPRNPTLPFGPAPSRDPKPEQEDLTGPSSSPQPEKPEPPAEPVQEEASPQPESTPGPEPVQTTEPAQAAKPPRKRGGRRPSPVKGAAHEPGVSYVFTPMKDGEFKVTKVFSAYDPILKNNSAYKATVIGISPVKGDITNLRPTKRMLKLQQEEALRNMRDAANRSASASSKERTYPISILILVSLAAAIGGSRSCQSIATYWAQHRSYFESIFPDFPEQNPSHDCIRKMLQCVGAENGNRMLANFLCMNLEGRIKDIKRRMLHLDGQMVRAATNGEGRAPDVLNLYDSTLGIVLAHELVGAKTNEISHCCSIIKGMNLFNCVITSDALNTQKKFARAIIKAGGDYCLAVKGNHGSEEDDLMATFNGEPDKSSDLKVFQGDPELAHGRIEQRRVRVLPGRRMSSNLREDWLGLEEGCIVEVTTETTLKRKITTDDSNLDMSGPGEGIVNRRTQPTNSINTRYYISSLGYETENIANLLAQIIRGHWSVEELHWGLDMIFFQDRFQCKSATLVMGKTTLNKIADYFLRRILAKEAAAGRSDQELTRPVMQQLYSSPDKAIPMLCTLFQENMNAGQSQDLEQQES